MIFNGQQCQGHCFANTCDITYPHSSLLQVPLGCHAGDRLLCSKATSITVPACTSMTRLLLCLGLRSSRHELRGVGVSVSGATAIYFSVIIKHSPGALQGIDYLWRPGVVVWLHSHGSLSHRMASAGALATTLYTLCP